MALVAELERLGVEVVFGLPGVHNLPIWKALARSPIRLVGVRHEQTAAYAADGYARASGRLGVAIVTTGPGAANAVAATGEAMASGSPVLVIATEIPVGLRRKGIYRGVLHESRDQAAMFGPLTKAAEVVAGPERIVATIAAAGKLAAASPAGPVYVGVPTDFLGAAVPSHAPLAAPVRAPASPSDDLLDLAASGLAAADRPLIWSGGGAARAGAGAALGELAERVWAPVVTTFQGRGILPPDHPCAVAGPVHEPAVGRLWDESDLVLAVGTDFDGMMTQNWAMPPPARLIAINVDPGETAKNYPAELSLIGDARQVLESLLTRVEPRVGRDGLTAELEAIAAAVATAVEGDEPGAAELLGAFARTLPADAVVVADMCIPGYWLAGYRQVPAPRKLAYPVGWGTLGFALPAAIGSALAERGPAVCVSGDGGFLFACGELATIAEYELPLTIVLVDDGGYGMLRFDQEHAGDEPYGVDLVTPDFESLAASFGIAATAVEGFGADFERELSAALGAAAPRLILVRAGLRPPPVTSPRWYRRSAA